MTELLRALGLVKQFRTPAGTVRAVDGVDLSVRRAEVVALVGESGSGKTTLARLVMRLTEPTAGRIWFDGREVSALGPAALRPLRRGFQMVFQDPLAAFNPRATVGRILDEPLRLAGLMGRRARRGAVASLLERVGLPADAATRHPHALSGGQRQRVGIARALAMRPKLLVCDEPVSALDVSVRAQILNLLSGLQREDGLALLFVSHDLSVVRQIADRIAVMYLGRIVEEAEAAAFWAGPRHPYSQALIAAVPVPDPAVARSRRHRRLAGDPPSPRQPPAGCRFHPRCPFVMPVCRSVDPPDFAAGPGHRAACHLLADGDPASRP